jgi:hypothetical protein
MKVGQLLFAVPAVAAGLVVAVAVTPPFPEPDVMIDRPYESIVAILGKPNGGIPDKFVAWSRNRGPLRWDFELYTNESPPVPTSMSRAASRCLWVPALGIPIRCKMVSHAKVVSSIGQP